MKRRRVRRNYSKRLFRNTVSRVHRKNLVSHRGGRRF